MSERRKKPYRQRLLDDLRICEAIVANYPNDPYNSDMLEIIEIINEKLDNLKKYQREYYHANKVTRGKK